MKVILFIFRCTFFWTLVINFFLKIVITCFYSSFQVFYNNFSFYFYFVPFLTVEAAYHRIIKIIERKWWLFENFLVFHEIISLWWHPGPGVNIPKLPTYVLKEKIFTAIMYCIRDSFLNVRGFIFPHLYVFVFLLGIL